MAANTTVMITDMAILVGIFLLGFLAKMFPKGREQKTLDREQRDRGQVSRG